MYYSFPVEVVSNAAAPTQRITTRTAICIAPCSDAALASPTPQRSVRLHLEFAGPALLCLLSWVGTTLAVPEMGTKSAGEALQSSQSSQNPQSSIGEFARLAAQLTAHRNDGAAPQLEAVQESALEILDRVVLEHLNSGSASRSGSAAADVPDAASALAQLNEALALFIVHQPAIGESYRVSRLGANPAVYVLTANFGSSGPSAVRLYAGAPGASALAARIDRYTQKDFFDDYLELVPISVPATDKFTVFVTVSGRTDDLQTGIFTAWRFDGHDVAAVWTSDIIEQSAYEAAADGFRVSYCADAEPDTTRTCAKMQRDHYRWQNGTWQRAETIAPPSSAAKP